MKLFIFPFQPLQDAHGLLHRGLVDVDLLETPHDALALGEETVVLIVCGGTDEPDVAALEVRLEHVGSIHRPLTSAPGTHKVVYLVDIDDSLPLTLRPIHDEFHAFLKVTPELRASQECPEVHLVDAAANQAFGHLSLSDAGCQSVDQGGLSHSRLPHMQRVVFLTPAKHLYGTLQLYLTAYEGIAQCHKVVEACHLRAPCLVVFLRFLPCLRLFMLHDIVIAATILGDDSAEKALHVVAHRLGKQVGCL